MLYEKVRISVSFVFADVDVGSANDPYKVLDRLDKPFFVPEAAFEKSGQYKDGTVFIEGLAYFKNKLYLYYGCADSQVAVAICDDNIDSKLKTHN